jgi:hypothetical protein
MRDGFISVLTPWKLPAAIRDGFHLSGKIFKNIINRHNE